MRRPIAGRREHGGTGRREARPALLAGTVAALVLTALAPAIAAQAGAPGGRVGPGQGFAGLVNGRPGTSAPVTIAMACAGAVKPGQRGHPFGGQTLSLVRRESVAGAPGHTGPQTTSVGAFFDTLPPSATSPAASSYVDFTRYGTRPLPTSLSLPCSGSGHVYFVPLPTVAGGQDAAVPVTYVPQP